VCRKGGSRGRSEMKAPFKGDMASAVINSEQTGSEYGKKGEGERLTALHDKSRRKKEVN